jgi:hypothetical protein
MKKNSHKWLENAARRATEENWALGSLLQAYLKFERKSEPDVLQELECTIEVYRKIAICRRPRPLRFSEDVDRISERFGLNPNRLTAVIRRAEVLATLATPRDEMAATGATLLAARDRRGQEDEP